MRIPSKNSLCISIHFGKDLRMTRNLRLRVAYPLFFCLHLCCPRCAQVCRSARRNQPVSFLLFRNTVVTRMLLRGSRLRSLLRFQRILRRSKRVFCFGAIILALPYRVGHLFLLPNKGIQLGTLFSVTQASLPLRRISTQFFRRFLKFLLEAD